jgi:hypothetical protein
MGGHVFGPGEGAGSSLTWLRHAPVWKAGLEVLDEPWRGAAPSRAMLVVMADGDVVHEELLAAEVTAPADAARALRRAVDALAAQAKGYPETLLVRDRDTAGHLASGLARHGTTVRVSPSLREVRHAIRQLAALVDVPDVAWDLLPLSGWDDDGIDPALAGIVFPAAARFWTARPWERVPDGKVFRSRWRDRRSVVALTHPKGHGHVITLFTSVRDYRHPRFPCPRRPVLGIRYVGRAALPRTLRRRIAAQGWEVAAPDAYPLLVGEGPAFDDYPAFADVLHLAAEMDALAE